MNDINLRINEIAVEYYFDNNSKFAAAMETSEANIRNYRGNTLPKIDFIIKLSQKLEINFEWLLLGKGNKNDKVYKDFSENTPIVSEPGNDVMPLVVTVDKSGNDNIVLVQEKAAAGYLTGYGDPKFLKKLPTYNFPNLIHGTFRMFQISGHSMYPTLHDNSYVVGQWVENWANDIKDDRVYVIVSKTDGIVVKRVLNRIEKYGNLYCKSDNRREYPNFQILPKDIIEVWEYKLHLSFELPNPADLYERLNDLEAEIMNLKSKIKK